MSEPPWPTWTQGKPGPKDVYAARGEEFVGFIPLPSRLTTLRTGVEFGGHLAQANFRHLGQRPMPVFCKADVPYGFELLTYDVDKKVLRVKAEPETHYMTIGNMASWRFLFNETVSNHPAWQSSIPSPKNHISMYAYETFITDNNSGTLYWAKYGMSPTWKPLESLSDLPRVG